MIEPDAGERASRMGRTAAGLLTAGAGLLGVAGVAASAAASHAGGGTLATTAGQFCLFHAAAILAIAAGLRCNPSRTLMVAAVTLFLGTVLFAGDLALAGFAGQRPLPPAAPIGGSLMLAGWLLTVAGGLSAWTKDRRAR